MPRSSAPPAPPRSFGTLRSPAPSAVSATHSLVCAHIPEIQLEHSVHLLCNATAVPFLEVNSAKLLFTSSMSSACRPHAPICTCVSKLPAPSAACAEVVRQLVPRPTSHIPRSGSHLYGVYSCAAHRMAPANPVVASVAPIL